MRYFWQLFAHNNFLFRNKKQILAKQRIPEAGVWNFFFFWKVFIGLNVLNYTIQPMGKKQRMHFLYCKIHLDVDWRFSSWICRCCRNLSPKIIIKEKKPSIEFLSLQIKPSDYRSKHLRNSCRILSDSHCASQKLRFGWINKKQKKVLLFSFLFFFGISVQSIWTKGTIIETRMISF